MNLPISVDQQQLMDVLLNVATVRPVFIWGAPGIGKSSIVEQFAQEVGLPCVSLLGSQLAPEDITEDVISSHLDTAGIPDPDLLIRTSGELRLSNYLMWQLAYTEFYFTEVPWPAFTKEELLRAIEKYNGRERRYGGIKEE